MSLYLNAVADAARVAGDVALKWYRRDVAVETKGDGSPVTIADRSAEQAVREWITARFPEDGIVGEELQPVRPRSQRRWTVDPIDGTKTFVRGVPLWGSLVSVMEDDAVLAGAAYFPAVGELLAAAPDEGCWWNGVGCRVSRVADLSGATVLTTDPTFAHRPEARAGWDRLASRAGVVRSWGDCYGYLLVATGRAEVMYDAVLSVWDAAPLYPIIREAGGIVTDWQGHDRFTGDSAIATNAALALEARRLLGGSP